MKLADLGLSYSDLAERLSTRGIETAKSTVGAWMVGRNEPPLATIRDIGEIVGLSVSELVGEDVFVRAGSKTSCDCGTAVRLER